MSRSQYTGLRTVLTLLALCLFSFAFVVSSKDTGNNDHYMQKRGLLHARQITIIPGGGESSPPTTSIPTSTSTTTTTSISTSDPPADTPSTTPTSTSSSTSSSSTSSSSSTTATTPRTSTTNTNVRVTYSYTPPSRSSSTTSSAVTPTETADGTPFLQNKPAVAATFSVVGLVAAGVLLFAIFHLRKKMKKEKNDDVWEDAASMAEFSSAGANRPVHKFVMPSAAALNRAPSSHHTGEDADEILAMPPVSNYERPRDSAYDIVPAPPPSAFNAPIRRGDTTSFGSVVGNDPFAGSGFVDATRDSTYGAGQAGRGAGGGAYRGGYSSEAYGAGYNQQPSYGYQAAGYGQQQQGYGGGYGYAN